MQAHATPPGLPSIGGSVAPPADSGQPKHVGGVASDGGESVLTAPQSAPRIDVPEAQRRIATILAQLERETGAVVEAVHIETLCTRTVGDDLPASLRNVRVLLGAVPGLGWRG